MAELLTISREADPSFDVVAGSELENQLKMLDLTIDDFAVAQALKPYVEIDNKPIIDGFYDNLEHHPDLIDIIQTHSSIERLKKTLRKHLIEMFSGHMNAAFIERRKTIAHIHVKIGLTQKWYIASFQKLFSGLMDMVRRNFAHEEDRELAMAVIHKLLNLEQQIVLEAYDDEVMLMKEQETKAKMDMIENLGTTSEELAALAEETTAAIEEMTAQAEVITDNSKTGTTLAVEAKQAAEQGKNKLSAMNESIELMQKSTGKVNEDITGLESTSLEIKGIIELVQSIAGQTNLLSLNASIEAARAGEHGRGFAVVADEVRKLAEQTAESVTQVTSLVQQTNDQIFNSSSSLEDVQKILDSINEQMATTVNAFETIDGMMEKTQSSNQNTEEDLQLFGHSIRDIEQSMTTVSASAERINQVMAELDHD